MEDSHVYKEQLRQIQLALESCQNETERTELQSLKTNIIELLSLTNDGENEENDGNSQEFKRPSVSQSNSMDDEFATFMAEMAKEGAVPSQTSFNVDKFKSFEGMKCRAPHKHQWGDTAYHNAMICSILEDNSKNEENFEVKVLFTNPTHQEMLPCPYFFNSDCKFTEDKCRFSHGEIVQFSDLQDYVEPNFELLTIGSKVLAKKDNNLWYRAAVRRIYDEKCLVQFESQQKDVEVVFEHVFPLGDDGKSESDDDEQSDLEENIDIINTSLIITPGSQALGEWEKYTKGIGSKLMQKMGYVVGTGLGKRAEGRIDPVTAVILPAGKSLDHCMKLRENAGGDKDLFSVEKKLKRMQKQQEKRNQKAYEREQNKVDVFNFLNKTLLPVNSAGKCEQQQCSKKEQREKMKKETNRNLNVASLQIDENIRRAEREIEKICESLKRHRDGESQVRKSLKEKLEVKINEVNQLKTQLLVIKNEQSNRSDKRKLTVF